MSIDTRWEHRPHANRLPEGEIYLAKVSFAHPDGLWCGLSFRLFVETRLTHLRRLTHHGSEKSAASEGGCEPVMRLPSFRAADMFPSFFHMADSVLTTSLIFSVVFFVAALVSAFVGLAV
jgi:hypothetical protein